MSESIKIGDHVVGRVTRLDANSSPCTHYFTGIVQDVIVLTESVVTTIQMRQEIERKYGNPYMLFHSSAMDPVLTRVDCPTVGGAS